MRLGRLGNDPRIDEVIAAAERRGDRLVLACDDVEPGAAATWNALLDPAACDVVLVGSAGWSPARAEAVRTLVQAGRPLLLSHPLELSMLWAFELDMIRRDSGAVLVPLLPDRLHPVVARLREAIEAAFAAGGSPPAIESLMLERRTTDRDREAVLAHLARDADLVRVLAGDPARLSALGVPDIDGPWSSLTVGLSGPNHLPVRWQLAPGQEPGLHLRLQLRLQSAAGAVEATLPDDAARPWSWTGPEPRHGHHDRGAAMLAVLDRALAGSTPAEAAVPPATWADAARAIELAETVPRSLARGRSVDLHAEEFTELGTFRGTMASLGCGLVLAALVVLVLATLVGGIAHELGWQFASDLVAAWPAVVLVVLGLFLLLQLLPLLVGGSRAAPPPDSAGRRHE